MAAAGGMSRVEHLMGTVFTIIVFDDTVDTTAVDEAFRWFRRVEETFSTFRNDSEISRIGRRELDPDEASREVRHVLSRCEELEAATGQRFSIRPGRPGGPGLDPAGFVKGWSVDEAAMLLRVSGVRSFFIDAGGDVLCVGTPPVAEHWRVGLRRPEEPHELRALLRITEAAVATSGTYFRGSHIWGGGDTQGDVTSVTVVGPSLGVADALATAIYGDQADSLEWMSAFPDYGVLLVGADDSIRCSEPLDALLAEPDEAQATDA